MYKIRFKLKLLLLVSFVLMTALNVNDYWLIEILVRYVCTSCVGIG
jgi:hypothetical protein